MPSLNLPKISLDPSKIKDRWGLAALGLIVWLILAYAVLSTPGLELKVTLTVLIPTLILLVLVVMVSFKPSVGGLSKPSPNIPSKGKYTQAKQMPTPQEIEYLSKVLDMYQHPEIQQLLRKKFGKTY